MKQYLVNKMYIFYLLRAARLSLVFLAVTGSVMAADQQLLPQLTAGITIDNFENNETIRYDLPLLKGTAPGSQNIRIDVNGFTTQSTVNEGRWRTFVSLQKGTNHLTLMSSQGDTVALNLNYQPMNNEKLVRLVYLLGSDSAGEFDAPPGVTNTLDDAIPRLQMAGRIIQSLTAELIAEKGLPRQTFQLLKGVDELPIVDTPISSLSINELRSMGWIFSFTF
jgi:hypothetical protein